jgi:hypothetical protein
MPFALIVTTPDGIEYIHNPAPVGEPTMPPDTKHAAALGILQVFTNEGVQITVGEAKRVAREVRDAPTDTPMKHHDSQLSFRIKEL